MPTQLVQANYFSPLNILHFLFFFSGISALIYQVIWQRMLFTFFGVDLESITIIVSVFMFGLGVGGLVGGFLANRLPSQQLILYILIEIGIAIFGFFSPTIINAVGHATVNNSEIITVMLSFTILAFPTVLMGATLPILVSHVNQFDHNIGKSVGGLYFMNTLGGAVGAFLAGFVFLFYIGLSGAIYCAAGTNLFIAAIALVVFRGEK